MQSQAQKDATARYKAKNKEKIAAAQAVWRAANQEKIKALREAYRSNPENRKKEIAYTKRWQKENPEKHKAHSRANYYKHYDERRDYRKRTAETRSLRSQKWNHANKERRKAYMSEYQKNFPEKFQEYQSRRRAIIRGASLGERKAICVWIKKWRSLTEVECNWCHGKFHPSDCHSDHVVPLGLDGAHCLSNLVIACRKCNITKNKQDVEIWIKKLSNEKQT